MTVIALLELQLNPEKLGEAPDVMRETLAQTRAFDGCLGVDVTVDQADETHYMVVERWASPEADAAYRAWRQTDDGRSSLGSVLAGAPALTVYRLADDI